MDKFNIDMPDDFEIKQQINLILDKSMPTKVSFYSYISKMYKDIGIRNIFHDLSELTYIFILTIAILVFSIISIRRGETFAEDKIYIFIFLVSPLFYLITNLLSYIKIKENNTYEIEIVCKYNLYQVASLRMLIFSVTCILLNSVFIIGLYDKINILRGLMISISSVFLFSSMLLYAVVKVKTFLIRYVVILTWLIINAVFIALSINEYILLLKNLPIVVYSVTTIISGYIYLSNIKVLSRYKKEKVSTI